MQPDGDTYESSDTEEPHDRRHHQAASTSQHEPQQ